MLTCFAIDEDVLGFDVPMYDATVVKVVESQSTLVEYTAKLVFVDALARARVQLKQVLLHVLEDNSNVAMPLNDFLEFYDVGVLQPRRYLQLTHEQLFDFVAVLHFLNCDDFVSAKVAGLVHFAEVATSGSLN